MSDLTTIIVEDEAGAANHLTSVLTCVEPGIRIRAVLHSISEAVEWITTNSDPHIAFFDIQLEDGLSFEIFRQCKVLFPVIFTTAYDQYAIEAFKVNSIDYLLKPIKEADLRFSLAKYKDMKRFEVDQSLLLKLVDTLERKQSPFTLLVRFKDKLMPVPENEFAYFYLEHGLLKGRTVQNQSFPLDHTIDDLVPLLNKQNFFRANRQVVVNRAAIHEAEYYFNGRLSLKMLHGPKEPVLISKARVPLFKEWLARGA
jgi:two-component system, LytTR family, response regulator LytT